MPDERTGEAVIAAVVRAQGTDVDADALRGLVAASLAGYKRIREVQFIEQIPRLPSGKVLRRELQSSYGT